MREGVLKAVHNYMAEHKNSYFLVGDLGYHAVEEIERDFPNRFLDVGIAEQNMIGIAAGLALDGNRVFVYSIIPFLTMRCYEQIRNDLCYHNLDVVLIGAGAGLDYGILGPTHFALEDIGIMRILPKMTVFSPADETEAVLGIEALSTHHGPIYVRTGGRKEPVIFEKPYEFEFGAGIRVKAGKRVVIISTGTIISEVLTAAEVLNTEGIETGIINCHTISPFDSELVREIAQQAELVVSIEEHFVSGGLGSAVAEVIAREGGAKHLLIGVDNKEFVHDIGSRSYLRKKLGLTADSIVKKIKERI